MLLLDSQVALWIVAASPRLGPKARTAIAASPLVHISAATIWELQIRAMLGKLTLPDDLRGSLHRQGFLELPVTGNHAEAILRFPELLKHDPFDRLLVAQASSSRMELVTADHELVKLGLDFVVDARV